MKTQIHKIDSNNISQEDKKILKKAGVTLRAGGLVAFPTETVYGLGANALDPYAVSRIFAVKGRPSNNPLIVHISDKEDIRKVVADVSDKAQKLIDKFWPGPLTIILERDEIIPLEVTGGLETVAVRLPDNEIARQIIRYSKGFVAAPSANISGRPSPTKGSHVIEDLDGAIDMIIDGGDNDIGIESTIIDLSVEPPTILRPGFITKEQIESEIGLVIDPSEISEDEDDVPKAPGMMYKHYAPNAELILVTGDSELATETINEYARADILDGIDVGIITCNDEDKYIQGVLTKSIGDSSDIDEIGRNLYAVLREFDHNPNIKKIYSQTFEEKGFGKAVMNRLIKAAGGEIIDISSVDNKREIKTVMFISDEDTSRGPMARAILESQEDMKGMTVVSRGLNVLFSEPINPKIQEVLKTKGISLEDYRSIQFSEDDIAIDTLYITMNEDEKRAVHARFPNLVYIFTLSEYIGEQEDEVITPFGRDIDYYYELFDILEDKVKQMVNVKE